MWTFYNKLGNQLRLQKGGTGCLIATGSYVGDGTTSHAITGVGFRPKYVMIFCHPTTECDAQMNYFVKIDQSWGDYVNVIAAQTHVRDNRINSLDEDGFTVDDDGNNYPPNASGVTYDWIALGYGVAGDWPVWDQVVKGWIRFDGTGTIAIDDSFNVSGIVDSGAGDYTVTWDTDFANADYACTLAMESWHVAAIDYAIGSVRVLTANNAHTALDKSHICVMAIGDQ